MSPTSGPSSRWSPGREPGSTPVWRSERQHLLRHPEHRGHNFLDRALRQLAEEEARQLAEQIKKLPKTGCLRRSDLVGIKEAVKRMESGVKSVIASEGLSEVLKAARAARTAGNFAIKVGRRIIPVIFVLLIAESAYSNGPVYALVDSVVPIEVVKALDGYLKDSACEFWRKYNGDNVQRFRERGSNINTGGRGADRFIWGASTSSDDDDCCCSNGAK
jgi:hypothetical protein